MKKLRVPILLILLGLSAASLMGRFLQQPYSMPSTSNIPLYLQYMRVDGAFYNVPNVVTLTAARTMTAAESGTIINLNNATGFTVTLPTPSAGLYYDVMMQTTQTGGTMKLTSGSASIFMQGGISVVGGTVFNGACNGTTHTDIAMNGTTTGGIRGTWYRFTGLTTTLWNVSGLVVGSGTSATPCDTTP